MILHTGILCFPALHFMALFNFFLVLTNGRFMAVGCIEQPVGTIFPAAFTHFVSLCYILVMLAIF